MTKVYYYLKRTQASAKEEEFDVPYDIRAKKDVIVEKLFPLTISMLANLSRKIIKGEIVNEDKKRKQLEVIAKFFVSYYYSNSAPEYQHYLLLLSAVAYYHIGQCGTAAILADKIDVNELHKYGEFAILICLLLKNRDLEVGGTNAIWADYLKKYIDEYNEKYNTEQFIQLQTVETLRRCVYEYGNDRDILFIDVLLALAKLKAENSTYKILKKYSSLDEDQINKLLRSKSVFKEMWPSQKMLAEHGFYNGKSGVIQLPTGAGKTKAIALCIYACQSSEDNITSVVVTPFRALTREVRNDLYKSLRFDSNISIVEVSDLLQDDYSLDIINAKNKHNVIVVTPEKLLYILEKQPEFAKEIEQIIFDEGHLFEDDNRGTKFELLVSTILFNTSTTIQKILISAVVGGVNELNKWLTNGQGEIVDETSFFPAEKNVVALGTSILNGEVFYKLDYLDIKNNCNIDYYIPRLFRKAKLTDGSMFPRSGNDYSIAIMLRLIGKDNCAIFCGSKPNVNSVLKRIVYLSENGIDIERHTLRNDLEEKKRICNLIEITYGDDSDLYKAAQAGVFAHHGGITDGLKSSVEYALQQFLITNVVCTSTLAQGVNIPIKNLIIANTFQGGQRMDSRDFQNLIGRVGRPGMYVEGNIIFSNVEAYHAKTYAWDIFKNSFDTNKEKCFSTLEYLCVTGAMKYGGVSSSYYDYIIDLYNHNKTNMEQIEESIKKLDEEDGGKQYWFDFWKTILAVLGDVEWFIASYDNQFDIEVIAKQTLAIYNLSEEDGRKLVDVLYAIKAYLDRLDLDQNRMKMFAKSMLSSDDYLKLVEEIRNFELNDEISEDEFFAWIIALLKKYAGRSILDKIDSVDLYTIAGWWIEGNSYKQIYDKCCSSKIKILKRKNKGPISMDDIVKICSDGFGYSSTLILNVISDYYRESEETDEWADYTNLMALKLKYGLPNKEVIYTYELGFNDRQVALLIYKSLNIAVGTKDDVKALIKNKKEKIQEVISFFPSYFSNVLKKV